jgi:hypothetical protein
VMVDTLLTAVCFENCFVSRSIDERTLWTEKRRGGVRRRERGGEGWGGGREERRREKRPLWLCGWGRSLEEGQTQTEQETGSEGDLARAVSSLQISEKIVQSLLCCLATLFLPVLLLLLLLWSQAHEVIEIRGLGYLWRNMKRESLNGRLVRVRLWRGGDRATGVSSSTLLVLIREGGGRILLEVSHRLLLLRGVLVLVWGFLCHEAIVVWSTLEDPSARRGWGERGRKSPSEMNPSLDQREAETETERKRDRQRAEVKWEREAGGWKSEETSWLLARLIWRVNCFGCLMASWKGPGREVMVILLLR